MAALVLKAAIERTSAGSAPPRELIEAIDDVVLGCAMPEAEQGLNVARIASIQAGIPVTASAVTVNRFCSSGLQAIAQASERIMLGYAKAALAGGTESMSMVPMGGNKIAPNPWIVKDYPDVYLTTGLVAENHARESQISREAQDEFALRSHERAIAAMEGGRFRDETIAVKKIADPSIADSEIASDRSVDEGPRRDTSLAALAALRPAFLANGTVTAGNSSQMSDGAAAVLLMEEGYARELGLTPLGRFIAYTTAGVKPELFGIGPVPAVRKLLEPHRTHVGRHRSLRAQRSVRRASARVHEGTCRSRTTSSTSMAARSRSAIRSAAPARASRHAPPRNEAPRLALRRRHHVCRRRHGRRGPLRGDIG